MTLHHEGSGGSPALRPQRIRAETEFLDLLDQKRRIETRLSELVELLDPDDLPRSGLKRARPGLLLFKGGRDAS